MSTIKSPELRAALLKKATEHHQSGRLHEAIELYRQVLKGDPTNTDALYNLGAAFVANGNAESALHHLQAALNLKPTETVYWLSFAAALHRADRIDNAREILARGFQAGLNDPRALSLANTIAVESENGEVGERLPSPDSLNKAEVDAVTALAQGGRSTEAELIARSLAARFPNHDAGWNVLRLTMQTGERIPQLLQKLDAQIIKYPQLEMLHSQRGAVLTLLGQPQEAVRAHQQAVEIKSNWPVGLFNLGVSQNAVADRGGAAESFGKALSLEPNHPLFLYNYAWVLQKLGRQSEAEGVYKKLLVVDPNHANANFNLSVMYTQLGRFREAQAHCEIAVKMEPNWAEALSNHGTLLRMIGRRDEAQKEYVRALKINPSLSEAYENLSALYLGNALYVEAEALLRQAMKFLPSRSAIHDNLGIALNGLGRFSEAEAEWRTAVSLPTDSGVALSHLAMCMWSQGKEAESVQMMKDAIRMSRNEPTICDNLLFAMGYSLQVPLREYYQEACNMRAMAIGPQELDRAHSRQLPVRSRDNRQLRVGYVSGDYRLHSICYFIEAILRNHNKDRVEVIGFTTSIFSDSTTERIRPLFNEWISLDGLTDDEARDTVEKAQIDVLIDLSGPTAYNRLGVFARRAALVQAHYLGYIATTGVREMDYWIGDEELFPGPQEDYFCETVWRLPRTWVSYGPKMEAPEPKWKPDDDGTIWVGSFNNIIKITPPALVLWAKLLHAMPQAKLLLKTKLLSEEANRDRITKELAELGIGAERLKLMGDLHVTVWTDHMAQHDLLDIALDPVGAVGGGTTTCDALWMGVPVITLAGERMAQRMSASMLRSLGRTEWIAHSEDDYIEKVKALAKDVEGRIQIRATLREQMRNSPVCDAKGLAHALEDAYEAMFDERWASGANRAVEVEAQA